jgi:hypothetical protein
MADQAIQAFDQRRQIIVDATEIRPGDWVRDLGKLREVESVEAISSPCARSVSVRFAGGADGHYATLRVPEHVPVTVWRSERVRARSVAPESC